MDEDNLYQNDGSWFSAASELQAEEAETEQTKLAKAKPLVRDVIKRFDERIAFYGTIDSVSVDLGDNPATYQRYIEANRLVRDLLRSERDYIVSLLEARKR